jgi:hypothetical protein
LGVKSKLSPLELILLFSPDGKFFLFCLGANKKIYPFGSKFFLFRLGANKKIYPFGSKFFLFRLGANKKI